MGDMFHFDNLWANRIALTSGVPGGEVGSSLEDFVREIYERMVHVESDDIVVSGMSVNAWIQSGFRMDAVLRAGTESQFTVDAEMSLPQMGFTINAYIIGLEHIGDFTFSYIVTTPYEGQTTLVYRDTFSPRETTGGWGTADDDPAEDPAHEFDWRPLVEYDWVGEP